MLQRYLISPRCRRGPPLHTTMASDVNITPTSSIVHNLSLRWLWGSPLPWRAVTPIWLISPLAIYGLQPPHILDAVLSVSPSPISSYHSIPFVPCGTIYCNEHPQPIQDLHFVLLSWSWSDQYILQLPWTLRSFSCHAVRFTPSKYGN